MSPKELYLLGLLAGWLSKHRAEFEKDTQVTLDEILALIKPKFPKQ